MATRTVSPGSSIQTQVNASIDGDTVQLLAGTHTLTTSVSISSKNITILLDPGVTVVGPNGTTSTTAHVFKLAGDSIVNFHGDNLDGTTLGTMGDVPEPVPTGATVPTSIIRLGLTTYSDGTPSAPRAAGVLSEGDSVAHINGILFEDLIFGCRQFQAGASASMKHCYFRNVAVPFMADATGGGHEVAYNYAVDLDRMVVNSPSGGNDNGANFVQLKDANSASVDQTWIHHNTCIRARADSIDYDCDGGFMELFSYGNVLCEYNYVEDSVNLSETGVGGSGLHCDDIIIRFNHVEGRAGFDALGGAEYSFLLCNGITYRDGTNWEVHDNTFNRCDGFAIEHNETGSGFAGVIADNHFYNNLIRTREGSNRAYAFTTSPAGEGHVYENNYVVVHPDNSTVAMRQGEEYPIGDFAEFVTDTGLGATDTWSFDEPPDPGPGGTTVPPPLLVTVTAPTSDAATNVIPCPDFAPAAILLWTTGQTSTGVAAGAMLAFGAADASGGDFWIGSASDDAVTTKNNGKAMREDSSIGVLTNGTPTVNGRASITMDSSSVTLTWDDAPASAVLVHAMILSDLDGIIAVGAFDLPTGIVVPDTFDVTNAGAFAGETPDVVLLASSRIASASVPGGTAHAHLGFGAFDSDTTWGQAMWEGDAIDAATNSALITTFSGLEPVRLMNDSASAGLDIRCDTPTLIANGFRLNIINIPAAATRCGYIAIKSSHVAVFSDTKPTSSTTKKTSLPFQPAAVLTITCGSGTDHAATTSVNTSGNGVGSMEIGAAVDDGAGGAEYLFGGYYADDGIVTSDTSRRFVTTDLMFMGNPPTPTTVGTATVDTFDADGVTLDWTSADGTARWFGGLAFEAIAEDVPDYKLHLTCMGVG